MLKSRADALAMGYLTTSLHWTFALAQLAAAIAATSAQRRELEGSTSRIAIA
jgi:hypothetical protein